MSDISFNDLCKPFPAEDIEWRIQQSGFKNGKPWAMALAYVTNRAIQQRLDDVCKPHNWRNEYDKAPDGGVMCGISIKYDGEWVTKWDGAENTNVEAVKGGLSSSMKRAGVQWGIGRYLYKLETTFVEIQERGKHYISIQKDKNNKNAGYVHGYWDDPILPAFALPEGHEPAKKEVNTSKKVADKWTPDIDQPVSDQQREIIANLLRQKGIETPDSITEWMYDNYGGKPENQKDAQLIIDDLDKEIKEAGNEQD